MPWDLCTAPSINSFSPLKLADRRDTWGKSPLNKNMYGNWWLRHKRIKLLLLPICENRLSSLQMFFSSQKNAYYLCCDRCPSIIVRISSVVKISNLFWCKFCFQDMGHVESIYLYFPPSSQLGRRWKIKVNWF